MGRSIFVTLETINLKQKEEDSMRLLVAHFQCWMYLLFYGMWNGECKYQEKINGKVYCVASSKGSISKGTLDIKRFFYVNTELLTQFRD